MSQRGSKPGERRGGRKKGTPNGATIRKAAATVEAVELTVDRIKREYAHIAFLDIGEAFGANGHLLPIQQMPAKVRRALSGIEVSELQVDGDGKGPVGKLHKIKFADKTKALRDMAQHLGMFVERLHLSGSLNIESAADALRSKREERLRK